MWTRKSTLLTGLSLSALVVGSVAKSWQVVGVGVAVLAFVTVNFFLYRRDSKVTAVREIGLARVFEEDSTDVDARIVNEGKRGVFMEVRDKLPRQARIQSGTHYAFIALKGGESARMRYEIQCPLLGIYAIGPLTLRLEDPFGLFYDERVAGAEDSLSVLPRKEDMQKAGLLSNLPMPLLGEHQVNQPGDGFDFFALREYVPGDTMRMVNWKASARSGKMMVNQMERVTSAEATVIFDGRAVTDVGPEDKSPRVAGARAAASVANWLFGKKDQVRMVIYDDNVREMDPAPAERMFPLILETLAGHQAKGNVSLLYAVRRVLPSLKTRTPVILISPLIDDPSIMEAASVLLANEMIAICISPQPVDLPGVDEDFKRVLLADRQRTIQSLAGFGVLMVDLPPGDSLAITMEKVAMIS